MPTMVSLKAVQASNAQISTTLPAGLVAVFLGGTSGIGEYTLKQFAKHTVSPTVYFVGRNQEAADRITKECQALNKGGRYTFIKSDTSLIKNVDQVCEQIAAKEKAINLLFLTQGTLASGRDTSENLHLPAALLYYGRTRFVLNLLPLVQRASHLRRVVTVAIATKEGEVNMDDWQLRNTPLMKARPHGASLVTLSLQKLSSMAPDVSFIHDFPGWVRGGVARETTGLTWTVIKAVSKITTPFLAPFLRISDEESGERHLFFATSAMFPAAVPTKDDTKEIPIPANADFDVATGVDGQKGSGVYSVDYDGTSAGPGAMKALAKLRRDGVDEKLWAVTEKEFVRITGKMSTTC